MQLKVAFLWLIVAVGWMGGSACFLTVIIKGKREVR